MGDILKKKKIRAKQLCPFCGGAGQEKTTEEENGDVKHYVECVNCNARTKLYIYLADAVARWDVQKNFSQRQLGTWKNGIEDDILFIQCSECKQQYCFSEEEEVYVSRYCPECGARLVQTEQIGSRKISVEDQIEMARRIYNKKRAEARKKEINIYRQREKAEKILRQMIADEQEEAAIALLDEEKDMDDEE